MKAYACPLHVSLSEACAQHILERHEQLLPDLTGLAILVPGSAAREPVRRALLRLAERSRIPGLMLPRMHDFQSWVLQQAAAPCPDTPLSELLDFAHLLGSSEGSAEANPLPLAASPADPWAVAAELLRLFRLLSLNEIALPGKQEQLLADLREKYGIRQGADPEQLGMEAGIVFRLWQAWSSASSGTLEHYRDTLRSLQVPSGTAGLYVCGCEELSRLEVACLRRMGDQVPVRIFTRPHHLMPDLSLSELSAAPPPPRAGALQKIFELHGGEHMRERAQACAGMHPESPLQDWIRVLEAEHAETHVHGIEIQIRQWLQDGSKSIGLVTEDRKVARRVRALLERAGIGIRDYSGWALSTTSAATVFGRWLTCLREDFPGQDLLDLLKSPFVRPCPKVDHSDAVRRLERIMRRRNYFRSALAQSKKHLAAHQDERNKPCAQILDAVEQAAKIWRDLPGALTSAEYFDALRESLLHLGSIEQLARDDAGQEILEMLRKTAFAITKSPTRLPVRQWDTLLRRQMEKHNYAPFVEQGSVTLISLEQAQLCEFEHLIIAGMDSRHYPKPPAPSFLLNDAVRERLGLPTAGQRQELELQRLQTLLLSARQALLTRQTHDEGEPQIESPWLGQIRMFHRVAYGRDLADARLHRLALHPETWVASPAPSPSAAEDCRMPAPSAPPALIPDQVSAAAHQRLVNCPYQFFALHILRLQERKPISEDLSRADFGAFAHTCLAAFYRSDPDLPGPWKGPLAEQDRDAAESLLLQIGDALMQTPQYASFQEDIKPMWKSAAQQFLSHEPASGSDTVVGVEQKRERQLSGELCLYGIVDRIDRDADGRHILTDYKTGSIRSSSKDLPAGEDIQLVNYALVQDNTSEVVYRGLKRDDGKPLALLRGKDLQDMRQKVGERLVGMHRRMREGAALRAHGDESVCTHCPAQGICRLQTWKDLPASAQDIG